MLSTCTAILAVDFVVFPRRHAKTEQFGVSLMDLGVGAFVFCRGLVDFPPRPSAKLLFSSLPLLILGLLRLVSVKSSGYQEHVSEYGVHWNFFFTLSCISLLAWAVQQLPSLLPSIPRVFLLASLVLCLHQLALSLGLTDYVFSHARNSLLDMNKEGVFSLPGYAAIYLAGLSLIHISEPTRRS